MEQQERISQLEKMVEELRNELHEKDIECAQWDEKYDELSGNRDLLVRSFNRDKENYLKRITELEDRLANYETNGKRKNFFQRLFSF